jgi:metal-responsive CopG/Arc/MetJ family transcriptional regulator
MRTKKKVSLTIDEEIYGAIEEASETRNITRSQIAEDALRLWLRKETEALMAKGYEEMADEDEEMAAAALEAQREILK